MTQNFPFAGGFRTEQHLGPLVQAEQQQEGGKQGPSDGIQRRAGHFKYKQFRLCAQQRPAIGSGDSETEIRAAGQRFRRRNQRRRHPRHADPMGISN